MLSDWVIRMSWSCVCFMYCRGQFKVPYFVVILLYTSVLKFSFKEVNISVVCCTAGLLVYLGPCSWSLHRPFCLMAGTSCHYLNLLLEGVHYFYFYELQVLFGFYGCWKWFLLVCRHMSRVTNTFTTFWSSTDESENTLFWTSPPPTHTHTHSRLFLVWGLLWYT
jgi:hypothetical protein